MSQCVWSEDNYGSWFSPSVIWAPETELRTAQLTTSRVILLAHVLVFYRSGILVLHTLLCHMQ